MYSRAFYRKFHAADILVKLARQHSLCDPECEGRCMECPQSVVQEAIDEIKKLRALTIR